MRRGWRAWLVCTRDAARAIHERATCRRRRLALHLALWARWKWLLGFLPTLGNRSLMRQHMARWLAAYRRSHREGAAMLSAAVEWHALARGYRRALRALVRHRLVVQAARAMREQHAVLSRLAALAEAVETWRRPRLEAAARCRAGRAFVHHLLRTACVQWCRFARLDAVKNRVVCFRDTRVRRWIWLGWRRYCTLPHKYDRLLREVPKARSRAVSDGEPAPRTWRLARG